MIYRQADAERLTGWRLVLAITDMTLDLCETMDDLDEWAALNRNTLKGKLRPEQYAGIKLAFARRHAQIEATAS